MCVTAKKHRDMALMQIFLARGNSSRALDAFTKTKELRFGYSAENVLTADERQLIRLRTALCGDCSRRHSEVFETESRRMAYPDL
jgi:hypothetical protein